MNKKNGRPAGFLLKIMLCIMLAVPSLLLPGHGYGFSLQALLDDVRNNYSIPGMSAAVVIDGEVTDSAVSGKRKAGSDTAVQPDDAFMLCSITKPVTATLAYILSEKNILPVESKIIDVFPELAEVMRPEYRSVTIEMLLSHRSGMPYMPLTEKGDEFLSISSDMVKRRYEYVRAALVDRPECIPGEKMIYGGGTIIVAAMMEKKTGKRWEELVTEYIFKPLKMKTAGFGAMSDINGVTGPWEHKIENGNIYAVDWPGSYSDEVHAPAGRNVHMSSRDLAKFMIASFPYFDRGTRLLSPASIIRMQQQEYDGPTTPGWLTAAEQWSDWKTVWHAGDNGKSSSILVFSQKYNSGFVIMANISGEKASGAFGVLNEKLKEYLASEITSRKIMPRLPHVEKALSYGKSITASDYYYNMDAYSPASCIDGLLNTRWATSDGIREAWIEVDLGKVSLIQSFFIREEFYPRVESYEITARSGETDEYKVITRGEKLGEGVVLNVQPFRARYVRLKLSAEKNPGPTISEFQVFSGRIN